MSQNKQIMNHIDRIEAAVMQIIAERDALIVDRDSWKSQYFQMKHIHEETMQFLNKYLNGTK